MSYGRGPCGAFSNSGRAMWRKTTIALACAAVAAAAAIAGAQDRVREQETIRHTLRFAGSGARTLDLGVVNGSIEVIADDRSDVELVGQKTILADSQADVQAAQRDVTLEIEDSAPVIRIA